MSQVQCVVHAAAPIHELVEQSNLLNLDNLWYEECVSAWGVSEWGMSDEQVSEGRVGDAQVSEGWVSDVRVTSEKRM